MKLRKEFVCVGCGRVVLQHGILGTGQHLHCPEVCLCCSENYARNSENYGAVCFYCCKQHYPEWIEDGIIDEFREWVDECRNTVQAMK